MGIIIFLSWLFLGRVGDQRHTWEGNFWSPFAWLVSVPLAWLVALDLRFVTWMPVISIYSGRDESVLYCTVALACVTVYCTNWKLLLCMTWCRLEVYLLTFLLNLSSTPWGVNGIEPTRAWSKKIDKPCGLFLGNLWVLETLDSRYTRVFPPLFLLMRSGLVRGMFGGRSWV